MGLGDVAAPARPDRQSHIFHRLENMFHSVVLGSGELVVLIAVELVETSLERSLRQLLKLQPAVPVAVQLAGNLGEGFEFLPFSRIGSRSPGGAEDDSSIADYRRGVDDAREASHGPDLFPRLKIVGRDTQGPGNHDLFLSIDFQTHRG